MKTIQRSLLITALIFTAASSVEASLVSDLIKGKPPKEVSKPFNKIGDWISAQSGAQGARNDLRKTTEAGQAAAAQVQATAADGQKTLAEVQQTLKTLTPQVEQATKQIAALTGQVQATAEDGQKTLANVQQSLTTLTPQVEKATQDVAALSATIKWCLIPIAALTSLLLLAKVVASFRSMFSRPVPAPAAA